MNLASYQRALAEVLPDTCWWDGHNPADAVTQLNPRGAYTGPNLKPVCKACWREINDWRKTRRAAGEPVIIRETSTGPSRPLTHLAAALGLDPADFE